MALSGTTNAVNNTTNFDQVWSVLQEHAVNKIINWAEGISTDEVKPADFMRFYTLVYDVCSRSPHTDARAMYFNYQMTFENHVSSKALPCLRGRTHEDLLQELLRRWKIHKTITRQLGGIFTYLDRYFVEFEKVPKLVTASHLIFYNLVYGEMNGQIRDAIISLINRGREGEEINQALLKESLDLYVVIGEGSRKYYEKDFEEAFMNATRIFYSRKASEWIAFESYEGYMLKVEQSLNQEKTGVSNYLKKSGTENRALEIAANELLNVHACKLEEKKHYHVQATALGEVFARKNQIV